MSWETLWQLNRNAIDAAFLNDAEKAALHARFDAFASPT
jgi:adenosine deaminase